jgi:hypothetical protein
MNHSLSSFCIAWAACLAAIALAGCGGASSTNDHAKLAETQAAIMNYLKMREELQGYEREANRSWDAELAAAAKEAEAIQSKLQDAAARKESMANGAAMAWEDMIKIKEEGKVDATLRAAQSFLRDYPKSPNVDQARRIQEEAAQSSAQLAEQKRKQQAAEAARLEAERKALLARFKGRQMTAIEMKKYLLGKSQAEVLQLMGEPTTKTFELWVFNDAWAVDEARNRRGVNVFFSGGRVVGVGLK